MGTGTLQLSISNLGAAALLLLLVGCASSSEGSSIETGAPAADPTPPAYAMHPDGYPASVADRMSDEQAAAMADGVVDVEEYKAGFERFSACLADAGYPLNPGVDKPSGEFVGDEQFIDYSIPNAAVESGVSMECYEREYLQLDITWQGSHGGDATGDR
ncbi:hypothetical protein ACFFGH_10645 [Lysobacter korlensis]|uniref:Lipoprotein n=1 Tax=Lysobacter korlensis TaxID=553636 RepID=A0ABV6RQV3_9GAMM